jgi:hypothetical protein
LTQQFKATILKKPYCILKANGETIQIISSLQKRFSLHCSILIQKELAKFNKNESQLLKKEMEEMRLNFIKREE